MTNTSYSTLREHVIGPVSPDRETKGGTQLPDELIRSYLATSYRYGTSPDNALRIGDDGKRQIEEFSGGRAALTAEADDKRSSSGLGEWCLSAHGGLSKIPRERPGLAVSDGSG